jgi:hypothetical protein
MKKHWLEVVKAISSILNEFPDNSLIGCLTSTTNKVELLK